MKDHSEHKDREEKHEHKKHRIYKVRFHFWRHQFNFYKRSDCEVTGYVFDREDKPFGCLEDAEAFAKSINSPIVKIFDDEGVLVMSRENDCWSYA